MSHRLLFSYRRLFESVRYLEIIPRPVWCQLQSIYSLLSIVRPNNNNAYWMSVTGLSDSNYSVKSPKNIGIQ